MRFSRSSLTDFERSSGVARASHLYQCHVILTHPQGPNLHPHCRRAVTVSMLSFRAMCAEGLKFTDLIQCKFSLLACSHLLLQAWTQCLCRKSFSTIQQLKLIYADRSRY